MKNTVLLLLVVLAACSPRKSEPAVPVVPAGFSSRTVVFGSWPGFASPPGRLTLLVPQRHDTLLAWVDASDTPMGTKTKYRFTSAAGCLRQESGFFKRPGTFCADTLDRLTIEVQRSSSAGETLATIARRIRHEDEVNTALGHPATIWKSKRLAVLNGRTFSLVESFGSSTLVAAPYEQLTAATVVDGAQGSWQLTFRFECKQQNCRRLAQQAYTTMNSVVVELPVPRP